jgi:hypothetical protein
MSPHPTDYRDLAEVQLTGYLARGVNPYLASNSPPFFYAYGFLLSLLVSLPARFISSNLLLSHKIFTVLCVLVAAVLVSIEVRKNTKSLFLQILGFALMLVTSWNQVIFILRPDSFGLLIVILIAFMLKRNDSFLLLIAVSFLTIAAFYIKQYFLFIALPVFLYEAVKCWKRAVSYLLLMLSIGIGSFYLVYILLPTFYNGTLIAAASSLGTFAYLMQQSVGFAKYYWPLAILMCYPFALKAIKLIRNSYSRNGKLSSTENLDHKSRESLLIYYFVFAAAFICLIPLGTSNGAWLAYYYQLALPPMIIIGLSALSKLHYQIAKVVFAVIIVWFSLYHFHQLPDFSPLMTNSDLASWNKAYALLDDHRTDRMFLSPVFADYLLKNEIEIVDNGNIEYYVNLRVQNNSYILKMLSFMLPNVPEQFGRYRDWAESISKNVKEEKYSIIAVIKKYHPLIEEIDLAKYYSKIDEIPLRTGRGGVWMTEFWIPNVAVGRSVMAGKSRWRQR